MIPNERGWGGGMGGVHSPSEILWCENFNVIRFYMGSSFVCFQQVGRQLTEFNLRGFPNVFNPP